MTDAPDAGAQRLHFNAPHTVIADVDSHGSIGVNLEFAFGAV
jgi:hypothetical protein